MNAFDISGFAIAVLEIAVDKPPVHTNVRPVNCSRMSPLNVESSSTNEEAADLKNSSCTGSIKFGYNCCYN